MQYKVSAEAHYKTFHSYEDISHRSYSPCVCNLNHAKPGAQVAVVSLGHAKPDTHATIENLNIQYESHLISTVSSSIRARSRCKSAAASASCLALVLHQKAPCEPCTSGELKQIAHANDADTTMAELANGLAQALHHKASCEPCTVGASGEMKQIAYDSDAGTTREMEPWLGS